MPDENGRMDPLEAADQAMLEHNPDKYEKIDGKVFQRSFGPFSHEPVKVDFAELEKRLLAGLDKLPKERVLAAVHMNRDEYRRLKATLFMIGYSVGSSTIPESARLLQGIKIVVDDSLTKVLYFDQFGDPMTPPQEPVDQTQRTTR